MSVFSCNTIGFGGAGAPPVAVVEGTGPTMMGIRTEAGMVGNEEGVGAAELDGRAWDGATLPMV